MSDSPEDKILEYVLPVEVPAFARKARDERAPRTQTIALPNGPVNSKRKPFATFLNPVR